MTEAAQLRLTDLGPRIIILGPSGSGKSTPAGAPDRVRWAMLHPIAGPSRHNRRRDGAIFAASTLPKVALRSPRAVAAFYAEQGLER